MSEPNSDNKIEEILSKFPFLSYGKLKETEYLGIIQNSDNQLLSMYVIEMIPSQEARIAFLELGTIWWWESNRQIPINIFHKEQFLPFRPFLKHFNRKEFDLIAGPSVSLHDTIAKRVRKRQITLVKKVD